MDKTEAIKATKNGAIAACISGTITLGMTLVAILGDSGGALARWNDPSTFFDIALIFGCAFGIYKKSRTAAILLFVYFLIAKLIVGIESGGASGIGIALVFLYFYGRAIQGTFVFHRIEKSENPNYKTTPKWILFTGISALILLVALMGIGFLVTTGVLPSTEVQTGSEISQRNRDLLVSNSIVSSDSHIEYFYSWGFMSILEGGSLLTDDQVVMYMPDENRELQVYGLYFHEIASIELIEQGNALSDSVYKVSSHDPEAWLKFSLSAEKNGDSKFIEALRSKVNRTTPKNRNQ